MKLDMHVHSCYSFDGKVMVADAIKAALKMGLSGLCLADHNNPNGNVEARKVAQKGFIVVPGCEVSSAEGHILCYGTLDEIPKHLGIAETIERIRDAGGIAVAAHPFRLNHGIGGAAVRKYKFDGIESFNARNILPRSNWKADALALECSCGKTGGSDAHIPRHIGLGYLTIEEAASADDVVEAIRKRKTGAGGTGISLGDGIKGMGLSFWEWARRKGDKI